MRFFKSEALTHVRLHPINTIKPRKKQSTTPLIDTHTEIIDCAAQTQKHSGAQKLVVDAAL